MFGISPLGWIHTLGSLPAIPLAIYMLLYSGRIVPHSRLGAIYFISMVIGALSVFIIAHQPISYVIGAATFAFLIIGYSVSHVKALGKTRIYIETIALSISVFLLMVPTVSETLRRVPDGHPIVTDLKSPLLIGAQGGLLVLLIAGLTFQMIKLRKAKVSLN